VPAHKAGGREGMKKPLRGFLRGWAGPARGLSGGIRYRDQAAAAVPSSRLSPVEIAFTSWYCSVSSFRSIRPFSRA
jgi:hypothetical protein